MVHLLIGPSFPVIPNCRMARPARRVNHLIPFGGSPAGEVTCPSPIVEIAFSVPPCSRAS